MKQKLLNSFKLRATLLVAVLCAVFTGNAWAVTTTYQHIFSAKPSTGDDVSLSSVDWNITATNLGGYNSSNYKGVQFGTSSKSGGITLTSSSSWGASGTYQGKTKITEVRLWLNNGSGTIDTYTVTIGGVTATASGTITKNSSATSYEDASLITYTPGTNGNSGQVVISVATSSKAGYICAMEIDCEESSGSSSAAAFTNETPSIDFPATTTYTQTATTAEGYTGTVTYQITANTAGATLDGATLTVTQEGSVTVKATAPAITGWTMTEATYTLTVNDTRSDNGLAYATATQDVVVGEVLDAPTLTNPHSLPVTYSSLDETIATVDASGNVTGVKIGSTTIKATFVGNGSYKAGSVSYTINVTKAPFVIEDGVFDFVEAGSAEPAVDYGSDVSPTTDSNYYVNATKTWTAENITMTTEGRYRWWNNGKTLRFYYDSTASTASSLTLTAPTNYVITKVEFSGDSKFNVIDGTLSSTNNGTWTGASNSVTFTYNATSGSSNVQKITVTYTTANQSITVTSAGWATLYTPYALDFCGVEGLTAYTASLSGSTVTLTQVDDVPANTGVVLKGTAKTHLVPVTESSDTDQGDLTGNAAAATAYNAVTGKDLYMLALNGDNEAQFTKVTSGSIAAGKAYLQVSQSSVKAFNVVFDDATGIQSVDNEQSTIADSAIYNLAGQRLSKMQKGINIVNGKKVLVK